MLGAVVAVADTGSASPTSLTTLDLLERPVSRLWSKTTAMSLVPGHKTRLGVEHVRARAVCVGDCVNELSTVVDSAYSRTSTILGSHGFYHTSLVSKLSLQRRLLGILTVGRVSNCTGTKPRDGRSGDCRWCADTGAGVAGVADIANSVLGRSTVGCQYGDGVLVLSTRPARSCVLSGLLKRDQTEEWRLDQALVERIVRLDGNTPLTRGRKDRGWADWGD